MPWDDEDDWVGEPPAGRHSAARADPGYWWRHQPRQIVGGLVLLVALVVTAVALVA